MQKKVVIVGLGLIGGSLAKAFRKYTGCPVAGIDRDPAAEGAALRCGAVRKIAGEDDLRGADLIYLCVYPGAAVGFVRRNLGLLRPGCVVTDTCGVKARLCRAMEPLARRGGFSFVGGHPMAGSEQSGFAASDADLFRGAGYLLTPCGAPPGAVETLKAAARALGFGPVTVTTPEEHDRRIAFTSQLPHAAACAYAAGPLCAGSAGFAGGSFRDFSRVARINEELWAELFLENRGPLLDELDGLSARLAELRAAVAANDEKKLRALLRRSRENKEALEE